MIMRRRFDQQQFIMNVYQTGSIDNRNCVLVLQCVEGGVMSVLLYECFQCFGQKYMAWRRLCAGTQSVEFLYLDNNAFCFSRLILESDASGAFGILLGSQGPMAQAEHQRAMLA